MNITIWENFNKRRNATKQPTGGTTKSVALKDGADIENPTFILNDTIFDINYVQAFGKYYFARCRNLDGHHTEIICSVDPMATYKSNISAYTGLVEYTSATSETDLTDPRNMPTPQLTVQPTSFDMGWTFDNTGTYIVGVISDAAGYIGMTDYYMMTRSNLQTMCSEIFSQTFIDRLVDDFNGVSNALVSCIWLPFTYGYMMGKVSGQTEGVHIGRETLTASGIRMQSRSFTVSKTASINYPNTAIGYLRKAPYTTGSLVLPFVGCVNLDLDIIASHPKLEIVANVDLLTGDIAYVLQDGYFESVYIMSTYSGNCATKVPINGASYDAIGVGTGVMGMIGGSITAAAALVTGGGAGAVAAGLGAAAGSGVMTAKSASLHTQVNGAMSSAIGYKISQNPVALLWHYTPNETNLTAYQAEQGMPYFRTATLGNLSGYIKCHNASISLPGTADEIEAVNSHLNNGFYLD